MEQPSYVEVEISVYKPTGYAITYLVEGTKNRYLAVLCAIKVFKEQDPMGLACLNNINSRMTDKKENDKRVHIKYVAT